MLPASQHQIETCAPAEPLAVSFVLSNDLPVLPYWRILAAAPVGLRCLACCADAGVDRNLHRANVSCNGRLAAQLFDDNAC